jgi:hypothetical protein
MSILYEKPREYKVCHHVEIVTILSKVHKEEYTVSWKCARCEKEFTPKENK